MKSISRPLPRYRSGLAWLAGALGLGAVLLVVVAPRDAASRVDPAPTVEAKRIGMYSCAARGCHGAIGPIDTAKGDYYIKDGAYTTWLNFDPHARAYDVLLEARSDKITEKLKLGSAREAKLCLACHATASPPDPIRPEVAPARDGISCEACHGPAEIWNDKHVATKWRELPAATKALDKLTDLSTPGTRAKTCVTCHVGDRSRGMDMNHDLIAAGHPRLNFEFASYQKAYPKHWREKADPDADFEARSWAIGQAVTARAALQLHVDRAKASADGWVRKEPAPEAVWPEFSDFECFACHHDLAKYGPRQTAEHAQGKPGRIPWGVWPLAMLPDLAKVEQIDLMASDSPFADLKTEMAKLHPDPVVAAARAEAAIQQLDTLILALERGKPVASKFAPFLKELGDRKLKPGESWDVATQIYLARLALSRSGLVGQAKPLGVLIEPFESKALDEAFDLLKFPETPDRFDSPKNVAP